MNDWVDTLSLDNLVPYTHPSAAWSDRHSHVALSWPDEGRGGLQRLHALVGWGGNRITDALLAWSIAEKGTPIPVTLAKRNYRPDMVVQTERGHGITLVATACYPARNVVAVELAVRNTEKRGRECELSFDYPGKGVQPDWSGPVSSGAFTSVEGEPQGSWSTVFIHHEHGRRVKWVQSFVTGMTEGTTLELICLADLSVRRLSLPPDGEQRFVITLAFGLNRGRARQAYLGAREAMASGWTARKETERWAEAVRGASPLAEKYRSGDEYRRMYVHAIAGLTSLFIEGEGGYTRNRRVPWTTKDLLAIPFFWDTAFSCMGALESDPAMCQEAIECFVDNVSPRGGMPGTLCDTHRSGEGQAPVMTQAAWQVFRKSRDLAWLGRVYPTLGGYVAYWKKYHSSARGFFQYHNAGQIGDNDVRFDPVYDREQGNEPIGGFEPPDLNAFFVVEMRCLSRMAEALGQPEEARRWTTDADDLARRIVEAFYFPEHSMFFDVREGTREIFSGAKGPNMFLPLWAGVPLAAQEISRVIETHMLNPDEFFRELPFPSVSYDDPRYDPNGYWRGRIWPHIVILMIRTLWKHGYQREAELTADRLLKMFARFPWFHENYESAGGTGLGATKEGWPIGFPEYNWSHAAVIQLLLERYKEDPLV